MNEVDDLTLKNLLLYSYGCNLCKKKAIEAFFDSECDENEAFKAYSEIFCNNCIAAKIACKYEEYNNVINKIREKI